MAAKVDFKKSMKKIFQPKANEVVVVDVPKMAYLIIDGQGSPGECQEYIDAMAALYSVSYKVKFMSKAQGKDYVVPPSEGLWWADDMKDFVQSNRDKWKWTMMIMQPDWMTEDQIKVAIEATREKKPKLSETLDKLYIKSFTEGKAAQIMHIGPYSEEHSTIEKLHAYIKEIGGTFDGLKQKHHEIYISNPNRAKPETMKTVIRQPFK
ncbi:MAG: GyrI-like domain-containing protein [Promethearchaeota archaeon]